jgi:hypothetical protein
MMQAREVAGHVTNILAGRERPAAARRRFIRFTRGSTSVFFRLIRQFYGQSFRELFLNGTGPLDMHRAVLAVLAGQVFPRPRWKLRWRLWAFNVCEFVNRFVPLVPRQNRFSLIAGTYAPSYHSASDDDASTSRAVPAAGERGAERPQPAAG